MTKGEFLMPRTARFSVALISTALFGLAGVTIVGCSDAQGDKTGGKMGSASPSGKMGGDKMGGDKMSTDKMSSDKMGDKMGSDKMSSDKMTGK
jgi:pentapeptide MXKDX repeat protein